MAFILDTNQASVRGDTSTAVYISSRPVIHNGLGNFCTNMIQVLLLLCHVTLLFPQALVFFQRYAANKKQHIVILYNLVRLHIMTTVITFSIVNCESYSNWNFLMSTAQFGIHVLTHCQPKYSCLPSTGQNLHITI